MQQRFFLCSKMNSTTQGISRICHLNIRSLSHKIEVFKHFLISNQISICILSETWLKLENNISISNYNIIRQDRQDRIGGGVLVAIHESIKFEQLKLPSLVAEEEIVVVKLRQITRNNEDLTLVAYYNPPSSSILSIKSRGHSIKSRAPRLE